MRATRLCHLTVLNINFPIFDEQYKLWSSSLRIWLQSPATLSPIGPSTSTAPRSPFPLKNSKSFVTWRKSPRHPLERLVVPRAGHSCFSCNQTASPFTDWAILYDGGVDVKQNILHALNWLLVGLYFSVLKMETIYTSEISVNFYRIKRLHIPEGRSVKGQFCKNPRRRTICTAVRSGSVVCFLMRSVLAYAMWCDEVGQGSTMLHVGLQGVRDKVLRDGEGGFGSLLQEKGHYPAWPGRTFSGRWMQYTGLESIKV